MQWRYKCNQQPHQHTDNPMLVISPCLLRPAPRRCSEHESARLKHLALKKVTRREVLERSSSELAAARIAADEARFELARHMNEVRGQWLNSVVEVLYSMLRASKAA
jgi:Arf-GAP/coiled-coil/ANK repeat/PH domain-containing protein